MGRIALSQLQDSRGLQWEREQLWDGSAVQHGRCASPQSVKVGLPGQSRRCGSHSGMAALPPAKCRFPGLAIPGEPRGGRCRG